LQQPSDERGRKREMRGRGLWAIYGGDYLREEVGFRARAARSGGQRWSRAEEGVLARGRRWHAGPRVSKNREGEAVPFLKTPSGPWAGSAARLKGSPRPLLLFFVQFLFLFSVFLFSFELFQNRFRSIQAKAEFFYKNSR
jgi:hypothetical protein